MLTTFTRLVKANKDIVWIVRAGDVKIRLDEPYNTISGTYPGIWVNSPIESVKKMFGLFPSLFDCGGHNIEEWLFENFFSEENASEIEQLVYMNT